MIYTKEKRAAEYTLSLLPRDISREISEHLASRRGSRISEIRLRAGGRASVRLGREQLSLRVSISANELYDLLCKICDGAVYAHRDTISRGYISMPCGVRVGVVGTARYDAAALVGVEKISSLVFRIPSGECSFADGLCEVFHREVKHGMLIYSPPGVGKTTALRSLASRLGGGKTALRVCVVDERAEFSASDYTDCEVDILTGYKKSAGLEIAVRTMSPDLVMIDEIGAGEAESVAAVLLSGVPIVATAHAGNKDELFAKSGLRSIIEMGAFDCFVGISYAQTGYELNVDKI